MSVSDVDISNLALGFIGDDATVSNLNPPEGSAQAEHCARFYPMARDAVLEMHDWGFNTQRTSPALIGSTITEWLYAYQLPSDCLRVIKVLPEGATDDNNTPGVSQIPNDPFFTPNAYMPGVQGYAPVPFSVETVTDATGSKTKVLYCNEVAPDVLYSASIVDTTKFSPTITIGIAYMLAGFIAGPIYKGETGVEMSQAMMKAFNGWFKISTTLDANQHQTKPKQSVPWIANR